jgi:threonine synthase
VRTARRPALRPRRPKLAAARKPAAARKAPAAGAALRCTGCGRRFPLREIRYRCDQCRELLEVDQDIEALRRRHSPDGWKELFRERLSHLGLPYASGVWRYHEWVLPDLPADRVVSKGEGNTPLYAGEALRRALDAPRLSIKHEGENPTLSFKDRGMTVGVSWARHIGAAAVACASTGDTSAAMAAYAAEVPGLRGIVLLPRDKVTFEQLAQPLASGCLTLSLDTDFDGCMRVLQQFCERHPVYVLNSLNPIRLEGQKTIGLEALQQLGWEPPDWFVIPVGNAGNISALGKGMLEAHALGLIARLPRLAGVQAHAANPFYLSYRRKFDERVSVEAAPTVASAIRIGHPVSYTKAAEVIRRLRGVVEEVSEQEIMDAKARADASGVCICPNSGAAVAGYLKLRERGVIGRQERVVLIATAHGAKFSQSTLDYHRGALPGITPRHANPTRPLPATLAAVETAAGFGRRR